MIRAEAIEQHYAESQHDKVTAHADGTVVCTKCPWQYPPAESEVPAAELAYDDDNPPPTDPAPAMCPIDDDPGPVPAEQPEVPPLTLRDRIRTTIDNYFDVASEIGGPDPKDAPDLTDTLHAVVGAGADWTPRTEATVMSPAQALAFILDLPEWSRISRLGQLLSEAERAQLCFAMDHAGAVEQRKALQISAQRYHDALMRIARLTSTVDQPETAEQNVIGQIAADALVHRD